MGLLERKMGEWEMNNIHFKHQQKYPENHLTGWNTLTEQVAVSSEDTSHKARR